jgi:hypothetical protein
MRPAAEPPKHTRRILIVRRFTQHVAAEDDGRVGGKDEPCRVPCRPGRRFQTCDALDVLRGRLTGLPVLVHGDRIDLARETRREEQRLAARRSGGQDDGLTIWRSDH